MFSAVPRVLDAWGFSYRSRAFTWVKTNKLGFITLAKLLRSGTPREVVEYIQKGLWFMGNGYYSRANDEVCLLAVRGRMPVSDRGVRSLIVSPIREHSRKPEEQYERIERLYPREIKIELFARRMRPGWVTLGNEIDGLDIRESLRQFSV